MPDYIREVVEQLAFSAREDKRVDKRSGVSQRLPISVLENVVSNAERRALQCKDERRRAARDSTSTPRCPSITGKLELEYEGELKGGDTVARELIRTGRRQGLQRVLRRRELVAGRAVVRSRRLAEAG